MWSNERTCDGEKSGILEDIHDGRSKAIWSRESLCYTIGIYVCRQSLLQFFCAIPLQCFPCHLSRKHYKGKSICIQLFSYVKLIVFSILSICSDSAEPAQWICVKGLNTNIAAWLLESFLPQHLTPSFLFAVRLLPESSVTSCNQAFMPTMWRTKCTLLKRSATISSRWIKGCPQLRSNKDAQQWTANAIRRQVGWILAIGWT